MAKKWPNNCAIGCFQFWSCVVGDCLLQKQFEMNISAADELLLSTWVYNCFAAQGLNKLVGGEDEVDMKTL